MNNATGKHQRVGGALQGLRYQYALSPRAHREAMPLSAVTATLVAIERGAPAFTGLVLIGWGPYQAAASAVGALGLSLLRAGLERRARLRFQATFLAEVAHVVASRSAVAEASADRIQAGAFGAMNSASTLAVSRLPTLAGDLIAALILTPVLALMVEGWLAAVVAPCLVAAALVSWVLRRATATSNERTWQSSRELVDELAMLLRGRLELVAQGKADRAAAKLEGTAREWSATMHRSERMAALAGRAPIAVLVASIGVIAWFWLKDMPSAWMNTAARGLMIGTGLAIAGSLARAVAELGRIPHEILSLAALAGLERDPVSDGASREFDVNAPVSFESVEFSYDSRRTALRGLSLSWNKGEVLGIEGSNGSGKSTALRLVARLADPTSGRVAVGDTDLRELDVRAWRESISFLPQRPFLPERASVAEALRWAGEGEIGEAIGALEVLGLLSELRTRCPADPCSALIADLSMGERQKVALARVLGSRCPLLLLDEPDSWLDARAIEALGRMIRQQAGWRRVLMVAHDPRLLAHADRVVSLGSEGLRLVASA